MASTIVNRPCNVGPITNLGLRPSVNQNFVCVRLFNKTPTRRLLVVRASESRDRPMKKMGMSDKDCEAAVVAGNPPDAPPVPPKPVAPVGTPVVPSLPLNRCPRRNRRSQALRAAFQETTLSPANFVYPLFIHEGEEDSPIGAMPGCYRLGWRHGLVEEVSKARDVGVNSVVLFPKVPDALKVLINHLNFSSSQYDAM
ncbi:unnamed protein product [Ilex paraguariensis]|uniref:porphobilinogen synthase n=1 Tax=Ilex paraguariensis TaxID=185542 RepID=A0ABC8RIS7_9AQUA